MTITKHHLAQVIASALLIVAVGVAVTRKAKPRPPEAASAIAAPQDAVYAMLNAARNGDVKAYLAGFTGGLETSLRRTAADQTEPEFAKYLINSQTGVRGITVGEPNESAAGEVAVRVEYVYQDRNVTQVVNLTKAGTTWKISQLSDEARTPTLVPYGTPAK